MTKDKFQTLYEQVLVPRMSDLMHRQLTSVHEMLDLIAAELTRIESLLDEIAGRLD